MERRTLTVAVGDYPHTAAIREGRVGIAGADVQVEQVAPISRAFAPMVREQRIQVSEMAIATFLMAKAWAKPLVLLPVTLAARAQERALLCRADGPVNGPGDLKGKSIAIRSYSQTTALWLRGTLEDGYGVAASDIDWMTFEGAHVAEYDDPPFVRRIEPGKLDELLRSGKGDAAIFGLDIPTGDPDLRCVFPDPDAEASAFVATHGSPPINHVLVCAAAVADRAADIVAAFRQSLELAGDVPAATWPQNRSALQGLVALAARYAYAQGLLPRMLSNDEIWDGLPDGVV